MVEPASQTSKFRSRTPTQLRPGSSDSDESTTPSPPSDDQLLDRGTDPVTFEVNETQRERQTAQMSGDAPSSSSDRGRGTAYNRAGRSHSTNNNSRRPSLQTSSRGPVDNVPGVPQVTYPAQPQQYGGSPVYGPHAGFAGQYTMHPQSPVNMAHPSAPNYAYPGYTLTGAPEGSMIPPQNYAPQLVQAPVYAYQTHPPPSPNTSQPYNVSGPTGVYTHIPQDPAAQPSISPGSPQAPTSPQFHANRFSPTSVSSPQFSYSPRVFPSPSMYASQYSTAYPQAYSANAPEPESQGGWWYMAHPMQPSQQFDPSQTPYQSPYAVQYQQPGLDPSPSDSLGVQSQRPGSVSPMGLSRPSVTEPLRPPVGPPPSNSSSASSQPATHPGGGGTESGKVPPVRKSYHPNPPSHRSEWVMWVGNVPQDAIHDELWRFFNNVSSPEAAEGVKPGVLSIFLISRSSCAFVNFENEQCLHAAIKRFNARQLRPLDPRCPRLVCRVRRKEDDLKAGVGGQRGMGMHTKWIKEKAAKVALTSGNVSDVSSTGDSLDRRLSSVSASSEEDSTGPSRRLTRQSTASTGSFASTNSSLLVAHFPQRYFILKSLSQFDLDLSVEKGVWATQKHNEGILDQAYRTSKDVYLIFGVNKSGEFYGYARMTGPIRQGERRVSWASRASTSSASSRSSLSPSLVREVGKTDKPLEGERPTFFSPGDSRLVDNSPGTFEGVPSSQLPEPSRPNKPSSAPPVMGKMSRAFSLSTPHPSYSLDQALASESVPELATTFHLDENAPIRAMKHDSPEDPAPSGPSTRSSKAPSLGILAEEEERSGSPPKAQPRQSPPSSPVDEKGKGKESQPQPQSDVFERDGESWGESFKVEWIKTERLPFFRTRHLRNPWNHDREVKVSRDGTELEPSVGQELLEEWDKSPDDQEASITSPASPAPTGAGRSSKLVPPQSISDHSSSTNTPTPGRTSPGRQRS